MVMPLMDVLRAAPNDFDKIKENFRKLLLETGSDEGQLEQYEEGSAQMKGNEAQSSVIPARRPKQLVHCTPPSLQGHDKEAPVIIGSVVLRDHTGKDINLDASANTSSGDGYHGRVA
ncbi:hypothetical protein D1007_59209 [Hordeum vulgare]|nr:hypothetical protein D1007_59209 [Hordeum vulgare]